jgi:hypothetical protein
MAFAGACLGIFLQQMWPNYRHRFFKTRVSET